MGDLVRTLNQAILTAPFETQVAVVLRNGRPIYAECEHGDGSVVRQMKVFMEECLVAGLVRPGELALVMCPVLVPS